MSFFFGAVGLLLIVGIKSQITSTWFRLFPLQTPLPVAQLIASYPSDGWIVGSNLEVIWRSSQTTPKSKEHLCREHTTFDLTVDEEKGLLNPSRDQNGGKHCRREVEYHNK